MPIFENFPYTNFHDLNLDYILKTIATLRGDMETYIDINQVHYADPLQWDITKQYSAFTIVTDDNIAYISKKIVPAGIDISNIDYWMIVFDLSPFAKTGIPGARIKNHSRYYIDGVNGDDSNPGTAAEPFKTLDKFLELSDSFSELRCFIVEEGTYYLTKGDNYSNINIHISATVPNVILDFRPTSNEVEVSGYNCHWKIEGKSISEKLTITGHDENGTVLQTLYFDNSTMTFDYCDMQVYFRSFGGDIKFGGCSLNRINLNGSIFTISDGTHITNKDETIVPLTFINCIGRLIGNFTGEELNNTGTVEFLNSTTSYVFCGSVLVPNNTTNKYKYGLKLINGGLFICTESRMTSMAGRAISGNSIQTIVPVITDTGIQAANTMRYYSGSTQYWNGSAWTNV